ncbi:MAG: type IV pilus biogenesis/stability protein PilW [Gammaproteobacteria bacterium]|jgi:type IV pilus assembly protein PilF|nr:type IV pilus biogenesis/stability protein PilW [Gammaproteobacteria bacterium]MBP6051204.1 type IV pilus biogenesis/stability protein PilW [Pseudomonadales bacterium]MBK6581550.1 type IV pilus biogenesis/stability protein PilW [Gammaproteobacteria bacterium]MBK7170403.1 type IV pilus biogenesis/stability protein PilW [Gammaproteobacteria bacterium]MBK7522311.1 type IV pilus biogenesis/stability protein PilW [Gammaproteobacteria bacterium]
MMQLPLSMSPLRALALALLFVQLLLQGCVTTVTGDFTADKKAEVQRRVEAADAYLQKGSTEQAMFHLRRALELDPNDASIHESMARVFWQTGEYDLADEHFRRAIALDPKLSRARNNYASLLYERGDVEGAIRQLEVVSEDTLYDGRAAAFMNLGKAYQKAGKADKAEATFVKAAKMDRRLWPAMLEVAAINFARGDYAPAQQYYEQFRRQAPQQTPRSLILGIQLARIAGDRNAEASYALQLKSMYPDSDEMREYSQMSKGS